MIARALAACLAVGIAIAAQPSPYLDQPLPQLVPERFAPGLVSTDAIELNAVFTPDLQEVFFARWVNGVADMFHAERINGAWTPPRALPLFPTDRGTVAVDMMVSYDGTELVFLGTHPHSNDDGKPTGDIWRSRRVNGKWTTANVIPAPVSTGASESYPTMVADGSLYFSSNRPGGPGGSNLYRAQRQKDGSFASPVLIPAPISTAQGVGDVFVAKDESYMVFSSRRPPSLGGGDLFVSFRRPDGGWGEPAHLGHGINTAFTDFCPMVTPDGKYFFFSRRHGATWAEATAGDVYWMDAKVLDAYRKP